MASADETVRKWHKRGEQGCQDRSSRPKRLTWRITEEERTIICAVRRATDFPVDDLTFMLRHFPAGHRHYPSKGVGGFGNVTSAMSI